MDRDRWERIEPLYHAALEREPEEREAFLDEACAGDDDLRREVAGLLASDDPSDRFIQSPAIEIAARALAARPTSEVQNGSPTYSPASRWLGAYQLLEPLGRGGMGEVYLALDPRLGRKVAIKLLPARFTVEGSRVRRFAQEARAASALNHPNIITIHEIGEAVTEIGALHYIVTEYIEGETLRQRMANSSQRRMKPSEAIDVASQIAAALSAADEAGIVHRDIKPENVMVRRDGIVKVLDFGLAKLTEAVSPDIDSPASLSTRNSTEAGMVMGTPRYMSPEQARGEKVDARTDIFSLGVLLYEMVTGRPPFVGATTSDIIAALLKDEPPPFGHIAPDAPPELERIIGRALEKERTDRYQTAKDMLSDLKEVKPQVELETKPGETAFRVSPSGGKLRSSSQRAEAGPLNTRRRRATVVALAALALASAVVVYFTRFAPGGPAIRSVAVLPFSNESGAPDLEYLSDGLSESLIDRLSQLPGVKVIARSSSFRYKGKEIDPREAAKALGVEALVMGRVVQRGDDLQVRAELVDAREGAHLWGEKYNRRAADIQAVQEEMARTISEKLRLRLSGAQERQLTEHATQNSQAYQFYLNGLFYHRKGGSENLRTALDYFNQAVALDPNFALAWVGVARANLYFSGNSLLDQKEPLARAKAATQKALELNEKLAEAHGGLARIKQDEWDWAGAEREYKRAIELNPSLVEAHDQYSMYLSAMGRHTEALAENQRAQELDPLQTRLRYREGFLVYLARRYDEAGEKLRQLIKMEPPGSSSPRHYALGLVYEAKGMYEQAINEYRKGPGDNDENTYRQIILGYALAMSGKRSEAQAILDKLKTTKKYVSPAELAILNIGLGDKEAAIALLERAYAAHDLQMAYLNVDPHYDGLRSDPRFQGLLRRVGLPQ